MRFFAEVKVTLKKGVLDPQGQAVEGGLKAIGYPGVERVRVGKVIELTLEADGEVQARAQVQEMAKRLLANPVLEDFYIVTLTAAGHRMATASQQTLAGGDPPYVGEA